MIDYSSRAIVYGASNKKREKLNKEYENFIEDAKNKNASYIMKFINAKADSNPVPIEAFVKSYKVIGERNGLDGEILKRYVKNRLIKSIERTSACFDTEKCNNCFAKITIEDIAKNMDKIK